MKGALENSIQNKSGVSQVAAGLRAAVPSGETSSSRARRSRATWFSSSWVDGHSVLRGSLENLCRAIGQGQKRNLSSPDESFFDSSGNQAASGLPYYFRYRGKKIAKKGILPLAQPNSRTIL
jgi:hypothetical protein